MSGQPRLSESATESIEAAGIATLACRGFLVALVMFVHSGCALMFPTEAGEDLAHFSEQAPSAGDPAPGLQARSLDGEAVDISGITGDRPVVLQLGSHSCPVYRYRRFDIFDLQRDYAARVDFVVVYTQEAHPVGSDSPYRDGEWLSFPNWITNTRVTQPGTLGERLARADWSRRQLDRDDRILVDDMDNMTWARYGAAPSAAFVIDSEGRIVLAQPWVEPAGIRDALDRLLSD